MTAAVASLPRLWTESLAITRRNLAHIRQVPESLIDVTLQPFMFVVLFAYVFGGSISVSGGDYKDFVVAGVFVQTLVFSAGGIAASMATDMTNGVIDRFRVLPMSRAAVLCGRVITDVATSLMAIAVLCLGGLVVGWGIHTDFTHALAGFVLLILLSLAVSWIGTFLGLMVRSPEAVMGVIFVTMVPLTFVANTYAPTDGMAKGIRTFAEWNPISAFAAAIRDLFGNAGATAADPPWPLQHPVAVAFGWTVLLIGVFAPLAIWRYRSLGKN